MMTEPLTMNYPTNITREDRIKGAIFGYLAGDALGIGTHWYYNLDELRQDYGEWIDRYQDPKPDGSYGFANISQYRYEQGIRAGDVSQTAQIFTLLLESMVDHKGYNAADLHQRLDEFFKPLSGESFSGRYTESLIKELIRHRRAGIDWDDPLMPVKTDSSDGAQLSILLALVIDSPQTLAETAEQLMKPLVRDDFIRQNQIVYALVVQALIGGIQLPDLRSHLTKLAGNRKIRALIGSFDNLLTPGNGQVAWQPETVRIEPALHVSQVYGMDCQVMHLLPAAYYLIHRYPDNFEKGLLSAINGGGNNMARAALTGALLGAMNGFDNIPERFVRDLKNTAYYQKLAEQLAEID